MKLLLLFISLVGLAHAHHMFTQFAINGSDQDPGSCLRTPPNTNPMTDINSDDMACNVNGGSKVKKTCAVDAGAKITIHWRTWPDGERNDPIDVSHQGPCAVYMKKMGDHGSGSAAGPGWFKIWHDGVKDGNFCAERLRQNDGKMSVIVPEDLAGGYYLMRAEQLALHEAQKIGGAQWYVGCIQLFVYSTGGQVTVSAANTVSIPGYVKATDPGVLFDYWANMHPTNYHIPGPAPIITSKSGGGARQVVPFDSGYKECLVSNGNWCAQSVPGFTNEDTCYQATQNCWDQTTECYNTAQATGHHGCSIWESVCESYQDYCAACGRGCSGSFPKSLIPSSASRKLKGRDSESFGLALRDAAEPSGTISDAVNGVLGFTVDPAVANLLKLVPAVRSVCKSLVPACNADADFRCSKEPGVRGLLYHLPITCHGYKDTCDDFARACDGDIDLQTLPNWPVADLKEQCLFIGEYVLCLNDDECYQEFSQLFCNNLPKNVLPAGQIL